MGGGRKEEAAEVAPDREIGHPDLPEEQRFLDRAYQGLEAMRGEASRMLESVLDMGRGGTFQSRTERDIVVRTSLARLSQLDIGDQALCFGRIDRIVGRELESFHIGRLAVSGPDHEPLVVDWRAPVAEPFYRATGLDPQGLARRRHLGVRARRVEGLEDEYFVSPEQWPVNGRAPQVLAGAVTPEAGLAQTGLVLGGPGALLAALGAARTGQMGDIVATIQREQDEIIRSPLAGVLLVQGGPGTGKTAVALHRAAYLLYTHRFPLERQGVLVVGPNPLFLRYIEQVLPSLGETGVTLSTVTGLVPEIRVRAEDTEDVAQLKGEARMSRFLGRAVRTRQRPLRTDAAIPLGTALLRLTAEASREIVGSTRRRRGPHNARRRYLENLVVRRLGEQYERVLWGAGALAATGPATDPLDEDGGASEELDLLELRRRLRRVPAYVEALDRMWPRLEPHELVHDLFGAPTAPCGCGSRDPHRGRAGDAPPAEVQAPRRGGMDAGRRRAGGRGPGPARAVSGTAAPSPIRVASGAASTCPNGHRAVDPRLALRRPGHRGTAPPEAFRAPGARPSSTARRTGSGPTATSWSTRCRVSRRCSCACWPGDRSRDR